MSNRAKFSACSARTKLITVQMISINWAIADVHVALKYVIDTIIITGTMEGFWQ